jgi:hypothetical protein
LVSTLWEAVLSWEVAARSVRSPCRAAAIRHSSPYGLGRHAAAGGLLRDPVAEFGGAVLKVVQVEPAQNRAVIGDEHVEGTDAGLLVSTRKSCDEWAWRQSAWRCAVATPVAALPV